MNKIILAAAAAGLIAASGAQASPNLVTNGSFESATIAAGKSKAQFYNNVAGWSGAAAGGIAFIMTPGSADDGTYLSVYGPFPKTSPDGGNFVMVDGDTTYVGTPLSQSISGLTAGSYYQLSFYQAAGQQAGYNGPTTERWQVSLGTQSQLSPQYQLASHGVGDWQQVTMTFLATASTETLSFLAMGTPNGVPPMVFLDGVSLTDVTEPATLALLGMGVGALGLINARRRRQSAA